MVLDELRSAVDQVCGTEPAALCDGESIVELHRCLARLEAATTRATASFDARREWADDGARSAPAWLTARCQLPRQTARRRVRLGRALRHLPAAERAWLAGEVGEAQVAALARVRTPATEDAMANDEEMLVGQASSLRYDHFTRVLAYWRQYVDPDGAEDDAERQRGSRRVHLSQGLDDRWFLDGVLDPISGAIISDALRAIADELFEADWAEARERLGEAATVADLARTPAQRRHDALVEMARRAGTAPEDGRRPEPLFSVLVGYETFHGPICQLANGTAVSPGSLVPWLDQAWVERVVFDAPSRVIDVGVARRLFTGATRRAVQVRDRECFHPLCDEPAEWCEVDHVEPWSAGGDTVAANGRPACAFHNRQRHRRP
ncbi:MAG: HNH endonuclease [Actinobacteria bacterium]|nr:HNH endonuclease [Actinomycetota bacterium]